jgi:PhnB protein
MKTKKIVPEGYHTVTPFVVVKGAAKLLDFLNEAFGAKELGRMNDDKGMISHAEARIGDSVIMMFDAKPDWPETPAFLRIYVESCDTSYEQAQKAGAEAVTKPTDTPWGDRTARVRDPLGNLWWIMEHTEDLTDEEIGARFKEKKYIDAMKYIESAEFFKKGK